MPSQFKATSVPLFKASGVPAMDADCCCEDPPLCFCSELRPVAPCICLTEDFGDDKVWGDAVFDITGSLIPKCFRGPNYAAAIGWCPCDAPTCVDISGSYVVPCRTTICYDILQFVCTYSNFEFGFGVVTRDYYYRTAMTLTNAFVPTVGGSKIVLQVELISQVYRAAVGTTNPQPYFDLCSNWNLGGGFEELAVGNNLRVSRRTWLSETNIATHSRYDYVLGGKCTEVCNPVSVQPKCSDGYQIADSDFIFDSNGDSCAFSDLGISVSLNAPT